MKYKQLSQHPTIFQKCTGITVETFDQMVKEVLPDYKEAESQRLQRSERQRGMGCVRSARSKQQPMTRWRRLKPRLTTGGKSPSIRQHR